MRAPAGSKLWARNVSPGYATQLLPTALRALALTCTWGGGRVSAVLAPFVLRPILVVSGPHAMFAAITAALVLGCVFTLGGPRALSGQTAA